MDLSYADFTGAAPAARLDRWLRFHPSVQARYERETGAARVEALRSSIVIGLCFYNLYDLTSIVLMPDILGLSIALRTGLVTPVSLALASAIGRIDARWRELLMLNGIIGAILVAIFLFWLTRAPLGGYTFGELALSAVFGNLVLALRFRDACVFTAVALAAAAAAVLLKSDLTAELRGAFLVQFATASVFTLEANYRAETLRCRNYLSALEASLRSEAAETAVERIRDLVEVDALTGLPNRRHLDRRLKEWFAERRAIAVMMIDIDHFKLFNDELGHPAGDDCLRTLAAAFAQFVAGREALIARFGGEEFVLVACDVDPLAAACLAAALVKTVEQLAIPHPGRQDGTGVVTASIGVAFRPATSLTDREDTLKSADAALYEAKRRGRNRFVFADARPAGPIAGA